MAVNTFSLIFFLTLSLLTPTSISNLSLRDLESAIFALRANGYNLFGNSIAVSDVSVQILSRSFNSSVNGGNVGSIGFTFLAPPNSALFSLDMNTDAFTYVHSLRFHVIPRRLTFFQLRNVSLSSNPYVETLVPSHHLYVSSSGRRGIAIDGVRISYPDLYLRPYVAVHGLEGILVLSNEEFSHHFETFSVPPATPILPPSPTPSTGNDGFISIHVPSALIDGPSPETVGSPAFSPEVEHIQPYSPYISGLQPFPSEYEELPEFIDETPPPSAAFSPESPPINPPIGAISSDNSDYDVIPASHDVAFTGGTYGAIAIPPSNEYSLENDLIQAPSPMSSEFLSPNEYSISPAVYNGEFSPAVFLPPSKSSSSPVVDDDDEEKEAESPAVAPSSYNWTMPKWSANPPPPPVTVGDWAERWGNEKQEKKQYSEEHTKSVNQGDGNQ